jgi:integrase
VSALTSDALRRWQRDLAKAPARRRTKRGAAQAYQDARGDDEGRRRRRATTNRVFTSLRAALNHAYREGKVESDNAWKRVRKFENATSARQRYLTEAEATRLLNACAPDFRRLVRAALETGARYGELARLAVSDFNPDTGTLAIYKSKSGKPRHIVLTDEGRSFFEEICAGRQSAERMLRRGNGEAWGLSNQALPMKQACQHAHISPVITFHELRHTWASLAIMHGVPPMVAAKNLGHRDTSMVERHYGHLAEDYVAQEIRQKAPRFGGPAPERRNIKPMSGGR